MVADHVLPCGNHTQCSCVLHICKGLLFTHDFCFLLTMYGVLQSIWKGKTQQYSSCTCGTGGCPLLSDVMFNESRRVPSFGFLGEGARFLLLWPWWGAWTNVYVGRRITIWRISPENLTVTSDAWAVTSIIVTRRHTFFIQWAFSLSSQFDHWRAELVIF
jgi:hypothetical protein